jgi:hypothetical protein
VDWRPGILLWATREYHDVWLDDGTARRIDSPRVTLYGGPLPEPLVRIGAEVRMFASLGEGQRVRWERASGIAEGCICEKCRFGAIVLTRDRRLVAVGFRKLWPAVIRSAA